jgi:predicted HicB family RNase H-like nuclease
MSTLLKHKGYCGTVEYSAEDKILYGQVVGIRSLISYEGHSVEELEQDFKEVVDYYLAVCAEDKREPEKPFKGSFNVRIGSKIHSMIATQAVKLNISLNQFVKDAILERLNKLSLHS